MFLTIAIIGMALLLVSALFDGIFDFLDFDTPFLSGTAIGAFLAGFGFTGMLLPDGWGTAAALLAAAIAGVVLAALAVLLNKVMRDTPTDATVSTALVIGSPGTVVNPIVNGEHGTVSVTVAGHLMRYNARSDEDMPSGTSIFVTEVLSSSSVRVAAR